MAPPLARRLPDRYYARIDPTPSQREQFQHDGFLIVEGFMAAEELAAVRSRFDAVFAHRWQTGVAPDEVNYQPGQTAPDRTRQLCNVWKADRVLARTTLAERTGRFAALLTGVDGMRLVHDNAIWKPAHGKALLAHQDAPYWQALEPPVMTSCWVALDATHPDSGTIYYARGSHRWPPAPAGGEFHAPADWLGYMRSHTPPDLFEAVEWVALEVPPGSAAFHDGSTWHGSPSNTRGDRERRSIVSHMTPTSTRWHPEHRHSYYSRYRRPGERKLDEAFFPVLWRADGYRTPLIDSVFAPAASSPDPPARA